MTMPARKPEPHDPNRLVPFNFRIPEKLVEDLDQWVIEQNRVHVGPHLTRSDVIRGVLTWAVRTKPEWNEGHHVLVIVSHRGEVLQRKPVQNVSSATITFTDSATGIRREANFTESRVEGGQVVTVFTAVPLPSDLSADALNNFLASKLGSRATARPTRSRSGQGLSRGAIVHNR
jgi:hypothetical protein